MTRKRPTSVLESRLESYYGGKTCVVSGSSEDAVDWAHLDENNQNTVFENLVPLSHRYNRLQEGWRRNQTAGDPRIPLGVDLQSRFLRHSAHIHFQKGRPALAVGACWLGVHLANRYPREFGAEPSEAWVYVSQTLFYLPYRMDKDLLRAALRRVCLNVARSYRPPSSVKSAVLLSIANLYQDLQLWSRAEEIYELLERHLPQDDPAHPAMLRRRAVSDFVRHGATRLSTDRLDRAADANTSFDFRTAVDIARAWLFLAKNDPRQALRTLDSTWQTCRGTFREFRRNLSPHNVFELSLTRAAAHQMLGRHTHKDLEIVKSASRDMPYTRLRSVFSHHVFPALAAANLATAAREVGTFLIAENDLLLLLDTAVNELVSLRVARSDEGVGWID